VLELHTNRWLFALAMAMTSACTVISPMAPAPSLFPDRESLVKFDFEQDALSQPPDGFETRSGHWSVADSPTSLSGTQVLVRGGDEAAAIAVKDSENSRAGAGEVGVRVFLGDSGAGLGCDAASGRQSYELKLEPAAGRVALYRKAGDSSALVAQTPLARPKGEWAHLGLRCEGNQVIGYVDGKPLLHDRGDVGSFEIALVADPGVTAQFDDLRYWARK
jgi:hypothetical protein